MKLDVKRNTKRNIVFGVIHKMILMIMPFIVRTVIRNILGVQYLGLNSLFSSILQVLSVTEMGFSTAVIYSKFLILEIVSFAGSVLIIQVLSKNKLIAKYLLGLRNPIYHRESHSS